MLYTLQVQYHSLNSYVFTDALFGFAEPNQIVSVSIDIKSTPDRGSWQLKEAVTLSENILNIKLPS
jgi:hypothetical protein